MIALGADGSRRPIAGEPGEAKGIKNLLARSCRFGGRDRPGNALQTGKFFCGAETAWTVRCGAAFCPCSDAARPTCAQRCSEPVLRDTSPASLPPARTHGAATWPMR